MPYQLRIKKLYEPLYVDQEELRVAFFSSPNRDSVYTDDPDVVKEGEVIVNIPDKGARRQIGSLRRCDLCMDCARVTSLRLFIIHCFDG